MQAKRTGIFWRKIALHNPTPVLSDAKTTLPRRGIQSSKYALRARYANKVQKKEFLILNFELIILNLSVSAERTPEANAQRVRSALPCPFAQRVPLGLRAQDSASGEGIKGWGEINAG